jgi:hypothetical protein
MSNSKKTRKQERRKGTITEVDDVTLTPEQFLMERRPEWKNSTDILADLRHAAAEELDVLRIALEKAQRKHDAKLEEYNHLCEAINQRFACEAFDESEQHDVIDTLA